MTEMITDVPVAQTGGMAAWQALLQDQEALLKNPGAHHKALIHGAYALHQVQVIDRNVLCDLLEQADGALAYAMEALLDPESGV
ncbi:hypothetical protein BK647_17880 [Pseudomonas protegens]|uniref:hypothetical protein n=1 Tax=Pseudomonas protegens TaxID=380021 RepID=UPI000F461382|nr:hypothetical protein [Pseudomonas protegens]ROM40621.1 hypothetical protein BK647_17880 [Pseudomonas protegens]